VANFLGVGEIFRAMVVKRKYKWEDLWGDFCHQVKIFSKIEEDF
jgi:hypothetical protein